MGCVVIFHGASCQEPHWGLGAQRSESGIPFHCWKRSLSDLTGNLAVHLPHFRHGVEVSHPVGLRRDSQWSDALVSEGPLRDHIFFVTPFPIHGHHFGCSVNR